MKRQSDFKTQPSMPILQPQAQPEPVSQPDAQQVAIKALVMAYAENLSRRTLAIICLLMGLGIGLYYAWVVDPVEWTGMSYQHLTPEDKAVLVELASDLNAYDPASPAVEALRGKWGEIDALACFVASQQGNEAERARLSYLAYRVNQKGCE